jgi:N-acetylmuramoyl-L-alanine amidase
MRIVLDAGHGGHDSGAVGHGLREKDLTLKIVQYMREIFNNEYEGHVLRLTRDSDIFLSLDERSRIANNFNAQFFLSVHINAHTTATANGYETFIWNGETVSRASISYQNVIHPIIFNATKMTDRGKKRANFSVLRQTNAPALLTEIGFISNVNDANKLKSDQYLQNVARAHVESIVQALGSIKKKTPAKTEQPKTETPTTTPTEQPFKDIPLNHWALQQITRMKQRGIMQGFQDGEFKAMEPVTQQQFAVYMDRLINWLNRQG